MTDRPKCWPYNTDDPLEALYWAADDLAEYPNDDVRKRRFYHHLARAAVARGEQPFAGWAPSTAHLWPTLESITMTEHTEHARAPGNPSNIRDRRHDLKAWPGPFQAMALGLKHFELRLDDRDYRVADLLELKEWDPQAAKDGGSDEHGYTGRSIRARVTYALRYTDGVHEGTPARLGIALGWVLLGLNVFTITGKRVAVGSVMSAKEFATPQVLVEGESD